MLEELQWLCFKSILINDEITYDTDMKSSGIGGGGASAPPKSFNLLKIWATSLKIRVKMAPNVVWLQKMAPKVCRKTREDLFGGHTKKCLNDLCGRECVVKSCTKNFSGQFGEIRAKILHNPKNLPTHQPMMKNHPRCSPFESTEGCMPPPCLHLPASLCTLFCTHSLYSLL